MHEVNERAARVRLVIFDVDGVLTDGGLYIDADGRELKAFHSRDGHGMKMLQNTGVEIGIITGRTAAVVDHRMTSLGVRHVYQGQKDKLPAFVELLDKLGLTPEQAAYVGDDVVDLPIMCRAGLAVTVPEAPVMVRERAHYVTALGGGRGAAREVCELVMTAQGTLKGQLQRYLDTPD
jgi:3-deoxy-D-manno-octulosonate 8-phosphate phosphatase (KDO 8-P phosphatase)